MINLNTEIKQLFESLCELISLESLNELKHTLVEYSETVKQAHTKNEFLDITLSEALYQTSLKLITIYEDIPDDHKPLVIGAIRYFIENEDADGDLDGPCGFDDDVEVMNYVLDTIAKPEWKIEL